VAAERTTVRVDATYGVVVRVGDEVHAGQALGETASAQRPAVCPISGIVEDVRFDPGRHEFVVTIVSAAKS